MPSEATADVESAAPQQEAAATPATPSLVDASGAYERWDFLASDEEAPAESVPATDTPAAEPPAEGVTESQPEGTEEAPEATQEEPPEQPSADDLSDAELAALDKALSKREKAKLPEAVRERIDQLVLNRYGNKLQEAREQAAQEALRREETDRKAWEEATGYYERLRTDEGFRTEQLRQYGEAGVLEWEAKYLRAAEARTAGDRDSGVSRQRFEEAFNQAAINEFQGAVKEEFPFYGELPEDTRKVIEGARFDPAGNWFADSLGALAKGVTKHIDQMERKHQQALEEAREAGRTEGRGERAEDGPVAVNRGVGQDSTSFKQVERAYAEGKLSNSEWERQKKTFGIDY